MKAVKIIGGIVAAVVLIIVAGLVYLNTAYPKVSSPDNLKVEITPARLARGKYLANHVTVCIDCHSTRDWKKFSAPLIQGTEGTGGERFDEPNAGIPGILFSANITPANLSRYTDGELLRTITQGVNKENKALFPLMPYLSYNHLTREDAYAIIAYIRSLPSVEHVVGESSLDFPMNMIVKTIPAETFTPTAPIDTSDTKAYGKYLVGIAACGDCHTQMEKGQFVEGMAFAGGREFRLPIGVLHSSNITPDKQTGIGGWSREQFTGKFKTFDSDTGRNIPVGDGEFNTIMPWTMYAGMTEHDLGAIYDYLMTVKPVSNQVTKFSRR
ncbi:MAG: cytochrome C [Ignavibacteriales bacterium]|nr:cytochrome C [Ignavibacteriales bacterium]